MRILYLLAPIFLAITTLSTHAISLPPGKFNFSIGGAFSSQGQNQLVNINKTFGNIYTVNQDNDTVFLAGAGYLFDVLPKTDLDISLGASFYYLSSAKVKGLIYLERTFPDLAYQYQVINVPLYATVKSVWNVPNEPLSLVVDFGIGPNFISTQDYQESSLDGGVTIPNQTFRGEIKVNFSAMAGIGLRLNHVWSNKSLEVGYKFFYLDEGALEPRPQVLNQLKTGNANAQALIFTLIF